MGFGVGKGLEVCVCTCVCVCVGGGGGGGGVVFCLFSLFFPSMYIHALQDAHNLQMVRMYIFLACMSIP